jgi:uracil-DNA glycosylase family 4
MSKRDEMKKIRDELFEFTDSPLYAERVKNEMFPVIGEGSHDAKIMFIGEAPGKNEAKTGKPFCGASGKILDELLQHIGISRDDVYITNVVKDRPTNNRDPKPEEIELYAPFLDRQIEIIKPRVIATLGRFAMEYIMKKFGLEKDLDIISVMHGKTFDVTEFPDGIELKDGLKIVPLYHPAVSVYNRTTLPDLKKDFEILNKVADK